MSRLVAIAQMLALNRPGGGIFEWTSAGRQEAGGRR
jgi:hypothetical protein